MRHEKTMQLIRDRVGNFSFDSADRLLGLIGPTMVSYRSKLAPEVEVSASQYLAGKNKGSRVIRVGWARSSSAIDAGTWDYPGSRMYHLVIAITLALLLSPSVRDEIQQCLANGHNLATDDRIFLCGHLDRMRKCRISDSPR